MDCMDFSQSKTHDADIDYWSYDDFTKWSKGCRLKHERNTWYHSFMGRPEIMDNYQKGQEERNKQKREDNGGKSQSRRYS
jgi:hypothetical protein